MARSKRRSAETEPVRASVEGVAKNLVDKLYGPDGPPWGTTLTDIEETVSRISPSLNCYREWITWVWQGRVSAVIAALQARQAGLGVPAADEAGTSPAVVVSKALAYPGNHRDKMKYDEYRKAGLPTTSSLMESAVKQINQRAKGGEEFWSERGSEALLQLRADQLSDGEILETFGARRQAEATGQRRYRRSA